MSYGHLSNSKGNKQWVWLAIDADTREIIGLVMSAERSRALVRQLRQSLPAVYGQSLPKSTPNYWEAYERVIPSKRHCAVGKESGLTSYLERLNNTMRQRVCPTGEEDSVVLEGARESYRVRSGRSSTNTTASSGSDSVESGRLL
jgi:IS1 family transposase